MKIRNLYLPLIAAIIFACSEDPIVNKVSVGTTLDLEVGGETQPNQVFVDLGQENQAIVARDTWDFGFYTGSTFNVVLNSASGMLAYKLDKTDLASVTAEDTLGLGEKLSLDAIFAALFLPQTPEWVGESINWADSPDGDLSKTAISTISENADNNNVYIINRGLDPDGNDRGWIKIKIGIVNNNYQISYSNISSSSPTIEEVVKNQDKNFVLFSADNGIVDSQPNKNSWDIAFTTSISILNFGIDFPYFVKDWVIINRNVRISEVLVTTDLLSEFQAFGSADISSLTFDNRTNAIGGNWRTVASPTPGSVTGVVDDRFYIIEDTEGNYYKLVFTSMLNQTGTRGYPQIQYELID